MWSGFWHDELYSNSHRRQDAVAAAAAAKVAEAKAAEALADAERHGEAVATGAEAPWEATGANATARAPTAPAAVVWVVGMLCKVKFGIGANPYNNKKARVAGVLAKHCHVELLERTKQGESNKHPQG